MDDSDPRFSRAPPAESALHQRLIICSNVLPVRLTRDPLDVWTVEWEGGILFEDGPMYFEMLELEKDGYEIVYVGVPNTYVPAEEHEQVIEALREFNCYPVFLDAERAHNHFQGFCKGILWPTFHNIIDLYHQSEKPKLECNDIQEHDHSSLSSSDQSWKPPRSWSPMEAEICWPDYCAANRQFSAAVIEAYNEGDIIWVHDYHLLLLPSFIYRKLPKANTGLFLHVPFPSSECFRTLANREEILRAMLCTNHLGFHLYEHARHFLTSCKRMLGIPHEAKRGGVISVKYQGRLVSITCSHIGINPLRLSARLQTDEVKQMSYRFAPSLFSSSTITSNGYRSSQGVGSVKLLVGVDEIEGLRGISLKLIAFERFLSMYPKLRSQVIFKQIGIRLDSRPADYEQCTAEIQQLVKKINRKWGTVVEYEEREMVELDERLALFKATDVFISSPVRGGLNVLPFEFLMSKQQEPGCIILSEFSTAARVLHGALKISPFKTEEFAVAIEEAVVMSLAERKARRGRDMLFINDNTIIKWSRRVITDIISAKEDDSPLLRHGFGFAVGASRNKNSAKGLVDLDVAAVVNSYKKATKRLFLIDYSGTLVETTAIEMYVKDGGQARAWHYSETNGAGIAAIGPRAGGCLETRDPISDSVRSTLVELCQDSRNFVVVISNDLRAEVAHALSGIPNLGMIAESGYVFRLSADKEWESVVDDDTGGDWYGGAMEQESSEDWQVVAQSIIQPYTERTNGAFCWSAPSAVSFNYTLADPELGVLQAENLFVELELAFAGQPIVADKGKGFITARLAGVNRGAATAAIISKLVEEEKVKPDYVVALGDDVEDERVFGEVDKLDWEWKYPIRVGWTEKKSKAKFFVEDATDIGDLLYKITTSTRDSSIKFRRSVSTSQLTSNFITKDSMLATADNPNPGNLNKGMGALSGGMSRATSVVNFARATRQDSMDEFNRGHLKLLNEPLHHSPSYTATTEENDVLFAREDDLTALAESKEEDELYDSYEHRDTYLHDPRSIPPTANPQSAMKSKGGRRKNESVTWDIEQEPENEQVVSESKDGESPESIFLDTTVEVDTGKHPRESGQETLNLLLSGFLGAGLMFIMLNTGKSQNRH